MACVTACVPLTIVCYFYDGTAGGQLDNVMEMHRWTGNLTHRANTRRCGLLAQSERMNTLFLKIKNEKGKIGLPFVICFSKPQKITMAPPLKNKTKKHPNTLPHDFVVAMVSSVRNRCGQKNRAYVFYTNQWEWCRKRKYWKKYMLYTSIYTYTNTCM